MDDTEIVEKLEDFSEFLSLGTVISDMIRWVGWIFIKGLAFIVDGLESVTDDILLIKQFFENPEIATFVDTIRPFLYILLAFSLAYAGYLLIFQKKLDREGMVINLLIALVIITSLSTGMSTANEFTDDAISAVNNTQLYDQGEGSLADNIISKQLTDVVEFDKNDWESTDIEPRNSLPLSMISQISITEKFSSDREELELSEDGQDIAENKITWVSEKELVELEDSTLMPWRNENYYRYSVNWLTLIATLGVMAFTLFSIAYKLARLSFELTFNYVLAIIIAPADVADGQKTKKILQSILNTFLVIILIFLSMKIYMIGTAYIANELTGLAYVIALIGFSVAVIDGPNIVERLFGIDAGLKNGWGLLAGAYAGGKLVSGVTNSASGMLSKMGNSGENKEDGDNKKGLQSKQGVSQGKAVSPNEESDSNNASVAGVGGNQAALGVAAVGGNKGINGEKDKDKSEKLEKPPSPNDVDGKGQNTPVQSDDITTGSQTDANGTATGNKTGGTSPNDGEKSAQGISANGNRVPSPNDVNGSGETVQDSANGLVGVPSPNAQENSSTSAQGVSANGNRVPSPNDVDGVNGTVQGSANGVAGSISSSNQNGSSSSNKNSVPSPNDVNDSVTQGSVNGSTSVPVSNEENGSSSSIQGSGSRSNSVPSPNGNDGTSGSSQGVTNGSGSQNSQVARGVQQSTMRTDSEIENVTEQSAGAAIVRNSASGVSPSSSPNVDAGSSSSALGGQSSNQTVSGGSGGSGRQQSSTNINRTGADNQVDENIVVNETQGNAVQGSRTVSSNNAAGASPSSSSNVDAGNSSALGGQNNSQTISGGSGGSSGRQQSSTNINRTGADNQVDENIVVNETQGNAVQGSRTVSSNNSGGGSASSGGGSTSNASGFNSSGGSSSSNQSSTNTVNQNSSSSANSQNETIINQRNDEQINQNNTSRLNRNDTSRLNETRRPRSYNLNQNEDNSTERMRNFRRNR